MGTLSLTNPVTGQDILASLHSNNNSAILAVINGGLDTANWASGKIFHPNKVLQNGATNGQALIWNGTDWAPGNASATPLKYARRGPGVGAATVSTTSGTFADIDATNLIMTFTAPSSGAVVVQLCALARITTTQSLDDARYWWNLRDSGGDVANTDHIAVEKAITNINNYTSADYRSTAALIFKTGLTSGNSYTWKWGHKINRISSGAGTLTGEVKSGDSTGFAMMVVTALPA